MSTRQCVYSLVACCCIAAADATRLAAQSGTDLFLVELSQTGGQLATGRVTRMTSRPGYDNQPHFTPDGRSVLFTTIDASGQADIARIDVESGAITAVTRTSPESEYSATPMSGGARFSAIRVERDSTQRLWSFRMDGSDPQVLLERIQPVGYHAWLDDDRLALFVLGDPATLQIARVSTVEARVIAGNIGRALQPVPGRAAVSFVLREDTLPGTISVFDPGIDTIEPLVGEVAENEFHVWTPSGIMITARGSVLLQWRPGIDADWVEFADLSSAGVHEITRLAVSPDGMRLVVVARD